MDDQFEMESDPRAAGAARRFVRDRLTAWRCDSRVDDAVLVASELVGNAVPHARTAIQLRLLCVDSRVRVEVNDADPRVPILSSRPADATRGRGLALVDALAAAWGVEPRPEGKVVWAELGAPPPPKPEDRLESADPRTPVDQSLYESEPSPHPLPPAGVRPPAPGPPGSNPAVAAWATSDSRNDTSTSASPAPKTPCSPPCATPTPTPSSWPTASAAAPKSLARQRQPLSHPPRRALARATTQTPTNPAGPADGPTFAPATGPPHTQTGDGRRRAHRRDRVRRPAGQPGENR